MEQLFSVILQDTKPISIQNLLRRHGFSRTLLRKLKRQETVYKNGQKARLVDLAFPGDEIVIAKIPLDSKLIPQVGQLDIIYEDKQLLVVSKPPGILTHPLSQEPTGTLANFMAGYLEGPVHLIGRLDRGTSGLVIAAKDPLTAAKLFKQRQEGLWLPCYLAFVKGEVKGEGQISLPLGRTDGRRWVSENGKPSLTRYKSLAHTKEASLLQITILTGRTNQIRIHMAAIGHPLLGEDLYAKEKTLPRPALHAWQVMLPELSHLLVAPLAPDLDRLKATLFCP
jgi:23S rRNA pseudouridine1911/1915/1917 synthase